MKKRKGPNMLDNIGKRYNDLKAEGKTGKEATRLINAEFGTNLTYGNLRTRGSRYKKALEEAGLSAEQAVRSEREEDDQGQTSTVHEQAEEQPTPDELIPSTDLDDRMRTVARQVFQEMIQNLTNERNIIADVQDVPPEPQVITGEGKGRRENRHYQKVSITIDTVLWDKIMQEKDRTRVSAGRIMDVILWRYFNKPPLSFQLPESEREALEVKYPKREKKQAR